LRRRIEKSVRSRPLFSTTFPRRSVKKRILSRGSRLPVQLKMRALLLLSYLLDYGRGLTCVVVSKRASAAVLCFQQHSRIVPSKKRILSHGSRLPVQLKKRTLLLLSYLLDYGRGLICIVASKRASANAQGCPQSGHSLC